MQYKIFGSWVESDQALPDFENRQCNSTHPSLRVRRASATFVDAGSTWELRRSVLPDPRLQPWSLYASDSRYKLEYHGRPVQFIMTANGVDILYSASAPIPTDFFQASLLNLVLPFTLHLKAVPTFHASAVVVRSEALVFIGHSGQGKSTLAAAFGCLGYPLITDDVLPLSQQGDRFCALPSLPWARLCRESFNSILGEEVSSCLMEDIDGKLRVNSRTGLLPFASEPMPVRSVYILSNRESLSDNQVVEITPIHATEAVGVLLGRDFSLSLLDREQLECVLAFLGRLTGRVPVRRLALARGLERLPEVVSTLVRHELGNSVLSSELK